MPSGERRRQATPRHNEDTHHSHFVARLCARITFVSDAPTPKVARARPTLCFENTNSNYRLARAVAAETPFLISFRSFSNRSGAVLCICFCQDREGKGRVNRTRRPIRTTTLNFGGIENVAIGTHANRFIESMKRNV